MTRIIILPVKVRITFETEADRVDAIREIKSMINGQSTCTGGDRNHSTEIIGFKKIAKTAK